MSNRGTTDTLADKRGALVAYVAPNLAPGETVQAVLSVASGPLPPFTPLVPVFGVLAMCTRWLRAYGIVVTDQRFLLVRKHKTGAGRPEQIEVATPLTSVEVVRWHTRRGYGTLDLRVAGQTRRLHVSGLFAADVPTLLAALPNGQAAVAANVASGDRPISPPRASNTSVTAFARRAIFAMVAGWLATRHTSGATHWIWLILCMYWTLLAVLTIPRRR